MTTLAEPAGVGWEAFRAVGMTYRRLDYATRNGLIRCDNAGSGTGYARTWPATEVTVAARIVELTRVGVELHAAAYAARNGGLLPGGWRLVRDTAPVPLQREASR